MSEKIKKMKRKLSRSTKKIGGVCLKYSKMAVSSEWFVSHCKIAFHQCNLDHSGEMNSSELVVAVLRLYGMLNRRFPGKNHKPPSTQEILKQFSFYNEDVNSGMSEEECRCRDFRRIASFLAFATPPSLTPPFATISHTHTVILFCQDICVELVPRVILQMIGSVVIAPFAALLFYLLICLFLSFVSETSYSIFRFAPRAVLTPVLASVFSALVLPPIVEKVEQSYVRLAEKAGAVKSKGL